MEFKSCLILLGAIGLAGSFTAEAEEAEYAKKLANPVPFQFNYDGGYGPDNGTKSILNVQPVIPFSVNKDWNVISRTIVPIVSQHDIAGKSGNQSGVSDITQSFFFSPKQSTSNGLIWGEGPAFLIPSATDSLLGGEKWGGGPGSVLLKQEGSLTYGALANHIWSFAGARDRRNVSATFLQPFFFHTTSDAWTFGLDAESSYDWNDDDGAFPPILQFQKS